MPTGDRTGGRILWVVGGGGLLGRSVFAAAAESGIPAHRSRVPWDYPELAVQVLATDAERFLATYSRVDLLWCAGTGVVGSSQADLDAEVTIVRAVAARLLAAHERNPRTALQVFLASSAGGVYAGSSEPPFTEASEVHAISPYGTAKLAEEAAFARLAAAGVSLLVGRIANLYGPGQNLAKPQGLITQLCRAQLQRSPLVVYVSLDTERDYVFVRDAAHMVLAAMDRLAAADPGSAVVKILASHAPITLASVVGELTRVTKRRTPIVLGLSPNAGFQIRDLRFRSVVWPELDRLATTTLSAGIAATFDDVAASLRRPGAPR